MGQTISDLKKILVYVKLAEFDQTQFDALKAQIETQSKDKYTDKVFFLADTGEIIVQGSTFGVSEAFKERVATLETKAANLETTVEALTGLTGIPADATLVEIADDSVIGEYVAKKIAAASVKVEVKEGSGLRIATATDDETGTTYTLSTDLSDIVDGDATSAGSIVTKDGKLSTNVELKLVHETGDHGEKSPYLVLQTIQDPTDANKVPVQISKFDVSEFVNDGMIDTVDWENGDPTTGVIVITWNTDSGKEADKITTKIDLTKLFNIEGIHTNTTDYLSVSKEAPADPDHADAGKANAWHVDAKVDATELTAFSSTDATDHKDVIGTDNEEYGTNYANDDALDTALRKVSGLADARKVAAKFAQVDKDIVAIGNDAIARTKKANQDIADAIAALRADLETETTNRTDADAALQEQITANKTAIDLLNDAEDVDGSVAHSIKVFKESLDSKQTYADRNGLVQVTVEMEDGAIKEGVADANENKNVVVKTDSLISDVQELDKADYIVDTTGYTTKSINEIAKTVPALVTTQDAWVYGQCIKTQAINAINSDDNEYIQIVRTAKSDTDSTMVTKIVFTPWASIHNSNELAALI